jgi:hypothetical protein
VRMRILIGSYLLYEVSIISYAHLSDSLPATTFRVVERSRRMSY